MKSLRELFVLIWCVVSLTAPVALRAQSATASLQGTITDPSGALVPEASGPIARARRRTTRNDGHLRKYTFPTLTSWQVQRPRYRQRLHRRGATQILKLPAPTVFDLTTHNRGHISSAKRGGRSEQSFR